jgi:putative DNA primase/helicase
MCPKQSSLALCQCLPPEPTVPQLLAAGIEQFFRRHVVLAGEQFYVALTLWVLFAWAHDSFSVSPILLITAPTKRSGKTVLLEAVSALVPRPLAASNSTAAAIFRAIARGEVPTILLDEADTFIARYRELHGLLNSGHLRSMAYVLRADGRWPTWAPKAIAMIGLPPNTILDRSIVIPLQRKPRNEVVEKLRANRSANIDISPVAVRWAEYNREALSAANPDVPDGLGDRQADSWRPLLAVAGVLGGDWPSRARDAAVVVSRFQTDAEDDLPVRLLTDLAHIFDRTHADRIASALLVRALVELPERPWAAHAHGKPLTELQLSMLLRPFGVQPRQWGEGPKAFHRSVRGYCLSDLKPVFANYVEEPGTPGTPGTPPR